MRRLFCAGALGGLILTGLWSAAWAEGAAAGAQPTAEAHIRATTLSLSAQGEVKAEPDMATITLGVTAEATTAQAAMSANAARMTQVMAALKSAGIAARDIQTSNLSLNARYAYAPNQPPRQTGYQAANDLAVTVRDLTRLGAAVDATVSAGANQVNGISFGLSDSLAAENAARLEAVKALQAKAELYARATGYRIQRIVSLSEGGGYVPGPSMPVMAMASRSAAAATPTAPGELRVRIEISGLYELAR